MKLNADKTEASDDIIKSSIKPDKRYWISNRRIAENKQKWLIQIYLLSDKYPNSGTVDTQMRYFLKVLDESSKKKDSQLPTLISLVTEIALKNPRVVPTAIAILSIFLSHAEEKSKLIEKIKLKFNKIPNSSFTMVWFQRLNLNSTENYNEPLCQKVLDKKKEIWNCEWLNYKFKKIIEKSHIVNEEKVKEIEDKLSEEEIKRISTNKSYYE